jgi:hypothetical protein
VIEATTRGHPGSPRKGFQNAVATPTAKPVSVTASGRMWWSQSVKNSTIIASVKGAATAKVADGPSPRHSRTSAAAVRASTAG